MDATTIRLQSGQLIALEDARGLRVKAETGDLWITQAGDERDIVLEAGESFVVDRRGLTLVNAPGMESSLTLEPQRTRSVQFRLRAHAGAMASMQTA